MKKICVTIALSGLLLAGCAEVPKGSLMPKTHHVAKAAPVAVPAPVVVPAPATFKQRWLHKFFRDRAAK